MMHPFLKYQLKHSIGKLKLPQPPRVWIEKQCAIWSIQTIALNHEVLYSSAELPLHHRDPFDRLIIATALSKQIPIITSDRMIPSYDVEVIW